MDESEAKPEAKTEPRLTIHFVRHACATSNLLSIPRTEAREIHNAPLSQQGIEQCKSTRYTFASMDNISYVFSSPLSRTLDTALLAFAPVYERGIRVVAWDMLRELGTGPCNTGDDLQTLRRAMADKPVDLSLLWEGWEKGPESRGGKGQMRVRKAEREIGELCCALLEGGTWNGMVFEKYNGEKPMEIIMVSHGGFLKTLLGTKNHFSNLQIEAYNSACFERNPDGSFVLSKHEAVLEVATPSSLQKFKTALVWKGRKSG